MIPDPTTEIKLIRHQLGADMDFDLDRIFSQLRCRQESSTRTYVRRPARKPMANHAMQRIGRGDVNSNDASTSAAR
jgi:hypothetical protein